MKRITVLGIATLLCMAFSLPALGQSEMPAKNGVLVHVSHGTEHPHRLLMGLQMAVLMAESGKPVLVYCDITAAGVLTKNAPDVSFGSFPSAKAQIKKLVDMGVKVRACPTCLKMAGFAEGDLMEGVKLADAGEFFTFAQGHVLTIDY